MESIQSAIHSLSEQVPTLQGKFGHMTQKQSDQVLRENIKILQSALGQLSGANAPAHHQQAKAHLNSAILNLQSALHYR